MNILIVDDEYYIVQGMKERIPWKDLGIAGVFTAYSAEQARKIYLSETVNILIADVEMPKESGLDLIRWVVDSNYDSVNILLTGHASFSYAQEAIGLKVFQYIIKPGQIDEITNVIKEAAAQISARESEAVKEKEIKEIVFWRNLYSGIISPDEDAVSEALQRYSLSETMLDQTFLYCYLAAVSQSHPPVPDLRGLIDFRGLRESLKSIFSDSCIADTDPQGYMISISEKECSDIPDTFHVRLKQFLDLVSARNSDCRFILLTFVAAPLYSAAYAYELLHLYASRFTVYDSRVISILDNANTFGTDTAELQEDRLLFEKWETLLLQGKTDDILLSLRVLLRKKGSVITSRWLVFIYYRLLNMVFHCLEEKKVAFENVLSGMDSSSDLSKQAVSSPEGLLLWASTLLQAAVELMRSGKAPESAVDSVCTYIQDHLKDPDLGRDTIAEAVHISPDYLSFLFHKKTGTVLSSYINVQRIEAAKKLLRTTSQTTQTIAETVGFANATYFHKQFKRLTGKTPNEWRQDLSVSE